jgi:hypothetical protein
MRQLSRRQFFRYQGFKADKLFWDFENFDSTKAKPTNWKIYLNFFK